MVREISAISAGKGEGWDLSLTFPGQFMLSCLATFLMTPADFLLLVHREMRGQEEYSKQPSSLSSLLLLKEHH